MRHMPAALFDSLAPNSVLSQTPRSFRHMPLILRYFWFLCAAVMSVNLAIWRSRLMPVITRGVVTKEEVDRFTRGAGVWFVGGPALVGCISLASAWSSPFCAGVLAFDTLPRILTSLVELGGWITALWWVWRGDGAEFLARVGPVLSQRPSDRRQYSATLVRVVVTVVVIFSAVGVTIAWHSMPVAPEMACPASAGAASDEPSANLHGALPRSLPGRDRRSA